MKTYNILTVFAFFILNYSFAQKEDGAYFIVCKSNFFGLTSQTLNNESSLRLNRQSNDDIASQIWILKSTNEGFEITNQKTGQAIDVFGSSQEEGSLVSMYDSLSNNSDNQTWILEPAIGNSFYLKAKHSNMYLTIENQSNQSKEGFSIAQYPKNLFNLNQEFYFLKATDSPVQYETLLNTTPNSIDNEKRSYTIYAVPAAAAESARMSRNAPCDVAPAGIYLKKGETLTISANGIVDEAQNFEVVVGELNHFFDAVVKNIPDVFVLKNGINKLTATKSGLVYFRYFNHDFMMSAKPVVHITINGGGQLSPLFIFDKTTAKQWKKQLLSKSPKVQIIGKKSLITVNRKSFNQNPNVDLAKSLVVLDNVINLCNEFAGFDNSSFFNIVTQLKTHYVEDAITTNKEYEGVYMYAGDGFIGMQSNGIFDLLDVNKLKSKWAIWHETGHLYQDNDWTFDATVEVSVNLFSLFIQQNFNQPSRLFEKEDNEKSAIESANLFLKTPNNDFLDEKKHENMVWIRLVMFQQLKEYLGKDFFIKLFQYYRKNPLNVDEVVDENQKIQQFIKRSCLISKTNLVDFFKKWGMPITDDTISIIQKLKYSKPSSDISKVLLK